MKMSIARDGWEGKNDSWRGTSDWRALIWRGADTEKGRGGYDGVVTPELVGRGRCRLERSGVELIDTRIGKVPLILLVQGE